MLDETFNNKIINKEIIYQYVLDFFPQFHELTSLTKAQALFYVKYGAICTTSYINEALKRCEKTNRINVFRNPSITTTGKPTNFMQESKGQTVSIKWVK